MPVCETCGKTPCECRVQDESKLYAYPKDTQTGEPRYVLEEAHYMNCPHCHERYDSRDPEQVKLHQHEKTNWGAS